MTWKLALKNLKRNIKDYVIYVITITIALSLAFAFSLIANSREVLSLCRMMQNFSLVMDVVNIFIVVAISFLVNYIVKFIYSKRSKEFGTYGLLGVKLKRIQRMFGLEILVLGLFSLVLSIPGGYVISLLVAVVLRNIFGLPGVVKLDFSDKALLIWLLYFVIIYGLVFLLQRRRTRKLKIHSLIYYDKQNEKKFKMKKLFQGLFFGGALVLIGGALIIFDRQFAGVGYEPNMGLIMLAVLMIIVDIYGLTMVITDIILAFILQKPKIKYHGDTLFLGRNLTAKIKTMSLTMATLMVLLSITLVALNISSLFKGMFDYQLERNAPYDVAIEDNKENVQTYLSYLENKYTIQDKVYYHSYLNKEKMILSLLGEEYSWRKFEMVVRLSDYNAALRLKGEEALVLGDDEYLLHVSKEVASKLEGLKELDILKLSNGISLKKKEIIKQGYTSVWGLGYGYLIVVPDKAVDGLEEGSYYLFLDTLEELGEMDGQDLKALLNSDVCVEDGESGVRYCYAIGNITVRGEELANNNGFVAITSLVAFYIAFIFTAIGGTILAVQIIDSANKNKYQYQILRKMGVREKKIKSLVFKQVSIFFLFPLVLPVVISLSLLSSMNKLFRITLVSDYQYLIYFGEGLVLFLVIYGIYFGAAYFGFKKNVRD